MNLYLLRTNDIIEFGFLSLSIFVVVDLFESIWE